jgi:hypothetical protein
MTVSIYNHQLCVLKRSLWEYSRQAISDWKNVYSGVCDACGIRRQCGGFFHCNTKGQSRGIHPISEDLEQTNREPLRMEAGQY